MSFVINPFTGKLDKVEASNITIIGNTTPSQQYFSSSNQWVVNHYKGYKPIVICLDENGFEIEGIVNHLSVNKFEVRFNTLVSGSIIYF